MISKSFINILRQRLRISNELSDSELNDLAEAAKTELKIAGVSDDKVNDEGDQLIRTAIVSYVKANYGFDSPEADQYRVVFENMKKRLTLSSVYRYGDNV